MATRASTSNPQPGDLVKRGGPVHLNDPDHWLVIDFFPWGCDGKHAWAIQNPATGERKIVFRDGIRKVQE